MPRSFLVKKTDDREILSDFEGGQRNRDNLDLSPGMDHVMDTRFKDEPITWKGEEGLPARETANPGKPEIPPLLLQHCPPNRKTSYPTTWQGKAIFPLIMFDLFLN